MLPARKPVGSRGGRPPIPHRIDVKVIWFVLVTGCRWEDVRIRDDRTDHVQDAWNTPAASVLCDRVAIRWGICPG